MLFEQIESPGLAHFSYLIGDGHEALVIDPRRDCDIYVEKASRAGYRIAHILETHRNEDYLIGSLELWDRTDAIIWHADGQWDYRYGQSVEDGQTWRIGGLKLEALLSPGHTPGSMSYILYDSGGDPWVVFTGDALFAGDVGRVDLLGVDRIEEMATKLFDTLFNRLLGLPDGMIVCPAHGAGSVCGSAISQRMWTTIGMERRLNPNLQHDELADFVEKVAHPLERPPYFRRMEVLNLEGPPILGALPIPTPLSAEAFADKAQTSIVVDTRSELSFSAAHVPDALSIWLGGLAAFAGWLLPYDEPILLVNETDDPIEATRKLLRLGYDELVGCLAGGLLSWHTAGRRSSSIETVTVYELCDLLDSHGEPWILDVRSEDELARDGVIQDAHHLHVTQLPLHLDEIPSDRPVYIFCGSGLRSMLAASLLRREGWENVAVVLGGLAAWHSHTCPIQLVGERIV